MALAVSYWCEGAKAKPWAPRESISWMNSDQGLVTLFLAGLAEVGVEPDRLAFRLSIHEGADERPARAWWAAHVGVDPGASPARTSSGTTPRRSARAGDSYRGCLSVRFGRAATLYQQLEGLVRALVEGASPATAAPRVTGCCAASCRPSAVEQWKLQAFESLRRWIEASRRS